MPKRFTDTQIWEKEWFMKLTPKIKCLWRYLTERCDQAGVWDPNWQLATIYIGEKVSQIDLQYLGEHIEILGNGKVFIPDFINFQYGRLSKSSPAHNPVFRAIDKNNLSNRVFNRVSNTLKEEEEYKEEELVKEKEEEKEMEGVHIDDSLKYAFDEITMDDYRRNFKGIDLEEELRSFQVKVRGAPDHYKNHGTQGLRSAFNIHIRSAKKVNGKPNTQGKFNP